eukprot:366259-Chlamydomonas_euryale.AAC.4
MMRGKRLQVASHVQLHICGGPAIKPTPRPGRFCAHLLEVEKTPTCHFRDIKLTSDLILGSSTAPLHMQVARSRWAPTAMPQWPGPHGLPWSCQLANPWDREAPLAIGPN